MLYQRKLFNKLKRDLTKKHITVITGIRRSGKTTLAKQLLNEIKSENKKYFDMERLDSRELFLEKNYDLIISSLEINTKKRAYIILDEIQLVRNIASVLKYLHDNYNIKFIVTGSSSFYLKNLFTESLAGRKKIFELFPLDFGEFLTFKEISLSPSSTFPETKFNPYEYERIKNYYEEYINYGGFPQVVLAKSISDKKDTLFDIISSYINVDVLTLADFRTQTDIYSLIKMLANRTGTKLDYVKLSRLLDLSNHTVSSYIDFFEKTYLVSRLPVFSRSFDREIVKAQKLYFCDNGLLNILAEVSGGCKFENAVFTQLRQFGELKYFSLKTGREIDFILNGEIALEIKEMPTEMDKKSLDNLARDLGIKKRYLIGRGRTPGFRDYLWGGGIR